MEVLIVVGPEFKREFKRLYKKYRSLLDDFETWKNEILNNPLLGDDLGGGVRKVRMAIASKGKGKSGGARCLCHRRTGQRLHGAGGVPVAAGRALWL